MKIKNNLRGCLTVLLLLALASATAFAQGGMTSQSQGSMKGAVIKGKAPVNKNVLKVKLPKAEEATLPNGLRVVLLNANKVPTFTMNMVILSGGLSDRSDYHGLSSFVAALLREGTTKRSSKEIVEQADALGTTLSSTSGLSSLTSTVTASGLVENLDQTLDIFADVIRNPTFPQTEVDKYMTRTLAHVQSQRSRPVFRAGEKLQRRRCGPNRGPLGFPRAVSLKKLRGRPD